MKLEKLKKPAVIAGVVAIGVYFVLHLIMNIVNFVGVGRFLTFKTVFDTLVSDVRLLILYGFVAFYLIYQLKKKNDNNDKLMNVLLAIALGLMLFQSIGSIGNIISFIIKYNKTISRWYLIEEIIYIFMNLANIVIMAALGINVIGLLSNKKLPFKLFTIIGGVALCVVLLLEIGSIICDIVAYGLNIRNLLLILLSLLATIAMLVFRACTGIVLYNKTKEIK